MTESPWQLGELAAPQSLSGRACIAVVAMSSPLPTDRLDAGILTLRTAGFDVLEAAGLRGRHDAVGHLVGEPRCVADDFTQAWLDPHVDAIVLGRGGYGMGGVVDHLDAALLRSGVPKPVVGFSDVTHLLHWLAVHLGAGSIHGPNVTGLADASAAADAGRLVRLLRGDRDPVLAASLRRGTCTPPPREEITGPLTGGNLAVLASMAGTGDLYAPAGAIVVLEDVGETPGRLGRALTQLVRCGFLARAAAVVFGDLTDCGDPAQVQATLEHVLAPLGRPVWWGAPIGHDRDNRPFPLGAMATLTSTGELTLARPVVRPRGSSPDGQQS